MCNAFFVHSGVFVLQRNPKRTILRHVYFGDFYVVFDDISSGRSFFVEVKFAFSIFSSPDGP